MKYQDYITDLHVNLHPNQLNLIDKWYEHCKETIDFFTLAYYPYEMKDFPGGMHTEDELSEEETQEQWKVLTEYLNKKRQEDNYVSYIGYEWQGSGEDGDHNVYFKENGPLVRPLRYEELRDELKGTDAIGIPHHLAYELGHRGKNWKTHDEAFSPFAEVYSHHGSSEFGVTDLPMEAHPHMGPRTGGTSVLDGLMKGYHFGIICSGDNHEVPGMVNHGRAGVWAEEYSKEGIWDAFMHRRMYGFTKNKIQTWMDVDGTPMGSIIKKDGSKYTMHVNLVGNQKIDHVKLIKNGHTEQVYNNLGDALLEGAAKREVTFKFKVECGWGPNLKIFPDMTERQWEGHLETYGKILSVEKDYNNFGTKYQVSTDESACDFSCTSLQNQGDFWMGASPIRPEGFIFEIQADLNTLITLTINGKKRTYTVREIIENTDLMVYYDEAKKLVADRFDFKEYYRSDPFYHNAYKVRVNQGSLEEDYKKEITFEIEEGKPEEKDFYYIKAYQVDGQVAWSSPIWFE